MPLDFINDLARRMVAARKAVFAGNEKAVQVWVVKTQMPREDRKRGSSSSPEASPKRTAYAPTSHMPGTEQKTIKSGARIAAKIRERGGVTTANTTAQALYDKVLHSPYQVEKTPLVFNVFNYVTEVSPHAVENPKKRTIDFGKVDSNVAHQVVATINSHNRKTWIPREKLKAKTMEKKMEEVEKKLHDYQCLSKLRGPVFREEYEKLKWGKYALLSEQTTDEEDYEEWEDSDDDDEVLWDEALGARVDAMKNIK
jgi:hypothetical protein